MSKHTPGPWVAEFGDDIVIATPSCEIAVVAYTLAQRGAHTANARLIAAAPELLEAVKAMIEWDDREQDHFVDFNVRMDLCKRAFDLARAAIAKATGETP